MTWGGREETFARRRQEGFDEREVRLLAGRGRRRVELRLPRKTVGRAELNDVIGIRGARRPREQGQRPRNGTVVMVGAIARVLQNKLQTQASALHAEMVAVIKGASQRCDPQPERCEGTPVEQQSAPNGSQPERSVPCEGRGIHFFRGLSPRDGAPLHTI